MRAILVDDELLALERLQHLLRNIDKCQVIGVHTNSRLALKQIKDEQPDVVFLDIHMPGLNGIEAAAQIRSVASSTDVIFTTAHHDYALAAYELEVLDYIVKPVTRERLHKALRLLKRRRLSPSGEDIDEVLITVHCLGDLTISHNTEEKPLRIKFRTAKIKELFAYLLHNRGKSVNRDGLLDMLWPELDERRAIANLYTSINRLRTQLNDLLGEQIITIHYAMYNYVLDMGLVSLDTERWENQWNGLAPLDSETVEDHKQIVDKYTGKYFAEQDYSWCESERQRLHIMWRSTASALAQWYIQFNYHQEALAVYRRIQEFEPWLEDIALALMQLYDHLNLPQEVEAQYTNLVSLLSAETGGRPGFEIERWYEEWAAK
ncbi:response regulator [Paenibacillus daejeonensis]|uniref:response regulator n=1 Tax=Paenibacillus daejeonensis TaxID=135193 RepID=UPI0003798F32|nr:response regulator [Paenibacillus daejeonensis]